MNCTKCSKTLNSFEKLLTHLSLIHANEHNFSINCNFDGCQKLFKNVGSFKSHTFRKHYSLLQEQKSKSGLLLKCKTCKKNVEELNLHLRKHCTDGQAIICPAPSCNHKYTVFSSYTSHFSRNHGNLSKQLDKESANVDSQEVTLPVQEATPFENTDTTVTYENCMKRNLALLQLKIQEKYMIPQSTVQKIFDDYKEIFKLSNDSLTLQLEDVLSKGGVNEKTVDSITSLVQQNHLLKCFDDLSSICKRKQYYKNELNYVEPITIVLGLSRLNQKEVYHYLPILKTLKFLLVQESILSEILNPPTDNNYYTDFKDGLIFKKHPLFSTNTSSLQIFLYCDEFEVCNPLGVNRKVHKLIAFYYVLGNIHPKFRSTVDNIQLVLLCKNTYVKKYGLKKVVEPLIKDLEKLRTSGVLVNNSVFYGDLAYVSADNLASHFIGGFLESFSPNVNKPCRTCLCSHEQLTTVFDDDTLDLRTRDNYNSHVVAIQNDPKNISSYGIKSDSPFNFGNFHVVEGLPPDIAHDLLEGVVPYEVGLILQHFIMVEKLFSLDYINTMIESFPYGPLDLLDKPCVITSNLKITQTAAKMWCLLRLIPLMCHTKIPEDNLYWALLLDLKHIVEIVFAPVLNIDYVALLKTKVSDHLNLFTKLFPGKPIKPKQHFLVHYARHILNFGPLKKCWTLRFEAKHYYFKRLATSGKNFKQLGFTLAQRHQMYQAYIAGSNNYLQTNVTLGNNKVVYSKQIDTEMLSLLKQNDFVKSDCINVFSFVSVNSLKYTTGMYVIIGFDKDDISVGCIEYILSKFGVTYFLLRHAEVFFNCHVGAYAVHSLKKWSVMKVKDLIDCYPLTPYFSNNHYFIVPKYVVIG